MHEIAWLLHGIGLEALPTDSQSKLAPPSDHPEFEPPSIHQLQHQS